MEINPFLQEKNLLQKMAVKTCCYGNVNIDEHVITTTLKYSQIILRRSHQDLVVIHIALTVLKLLMFLASSPLV